MSLPLKDTCTKLLELAKAATQGSWEVQCDPVHGDWIAAGGTWLTSGRFNGPDANFIAASNPQTISALCERLIRCEEALESVYEFDEESGAVTNLPLEVRRKVRSALEKDIE